jgi:hypothetical protein
MDEHIASDRLSQHDAERPLEIQIVEILALARRVLAAGASTSDTRGQIMMRVLGDFVNQAGFLYPAENRPPSQEKNRPSSQQIDSHERFRTDCQRLYDSNSWEPLLDLLSSRVKEVGRERIFGNTCQMFRSDYSSVQGQVVGGLISADEGKRRLDSIWTRVHMLINELSPKT